MATNPYAQFTGVPMDRDDIDELLTAQGYGILSLCGDGEPYSVPISFGYDGAHVYFGLIYRGSTSTKRERVVDGATVRLLVTDVRGRFDWQSVAVTGPVRRVQNDEDEWDRLIETLVDNGWFMEAFERSDEVESLDGWRLEPDDIEGLEQKEEVYE